MDLAWLQLTTVNDNQEGLMKTTIAALAVSFLSAAAHAGVIYEETFSDQEGKGAIGNSIDTGGVSWTIDLGAAALFNDNDYFAVENGVFAARDTNAGCSTSTCEGEAGDPLPGDLPTWLSPIIDTSGFTNLTVSVLLGFDGLKSDYELSGGINEEDTFIFSTLRDGVNNGPGIVFADIQGGVVGGAMPDTGTVQFRFIGNTYAGSERIFIDNIILTGDRIADVPVPSSVLLLLAPLGLIARRRLRQR